MKGYIIYDATTGAVKHHGIHPKLPLPSMGQEILEMSPESEILLTPGRDYYVRGIGSVFDGESEVKRFGHLIITAKASAPVAMPAAAESTLEAAIRENTAEVRALSARLEKMFNL